MADSKHTVGDLRQLQSLPLRLKIMLTQQRIRDWYEHWNGQVYVSFSGGKDSTVLKHIVDSMYSDVPAVFVNTGLEYPEIQRFVRDVKAGKWDCYNSDVEILRPEMRFDEVIKKYGYPVISKEISERVYYAKRGSDWATECLAGHNPDGTPSAYKTSKWQYLVDAPFCVSHKCCIVMKKKPAKQYERQTGRKPILGTMACESRLRQTQWAKVGCNAFDASRPRSAPLSFWTEQDVLHYIKEFNVPYCPVYGEIVGDDALATTGCSRTGCMFCMFGVHLEKEPNRFQRMKVTHPKQYAYCIDKLGLREVLEYIGVPYE
jgi:3'-phosphoadenosine 5'-phosphosulfate sulfotransferase (PAPS reductase)/FAD synthetase